MSTTRDTRVIQDPKAYRALLVILNSLRKHTLQSNLLLRRDLDGRLRIVVVFAAELVQVVRWDETRVESELSQTGEHAERVSRDLFYILSNTFSINKKEQKETHGDRIQPFTLAAKCPLQTIARNLFHRVVVLLHRRVKVRNSLFRNESGHTLASGLSSTGTSVIST